MNNIMTYTGLQDIVVFHGHSVQELQTALRQSVDGYLDACQQLGQSPQPPAISADLRQDMEDDLMATRRMRDIQSGQTTPIPHRDVMKEYAIND